MPRLTCIVCGDGFTYNEDVGYSKNPPICSSLCDMHRSGREAKAVKNELEKAHELLRRLVAWDREEWAKGTAAGDRALAAILDDVRALLGVS